jgi:hypothetical protein
MKTKANIRLSPNLRIRSLLLPSTDDAFRLLNAVPGEPPPLSLFVAQKLHVSDYAAVQNASCRHVAVGSFRSMKRAGQMSVLGGHFRHATSTGRS